MNRYRLKTPTLLLTLFIASTQNTQALTPPTPPPPPQPNILWIITDDQRPDSIEAFNQAVYGKNESPLGYVESPQANRLAQEGILFTQAICNAPVCGPSRGSMHSGRYPFRNGHYAFEMTHQAPDFIQPVVAQTLRDHGYATSSFGKDDPYIYRWGPGQGFYDPGFFDHRVHFKHNLQKNDIGDLFTKPFFKNVEGKTQSAGSIETILYADGRKQTYKIESKFDPISAADRAAQQQVDQTFEILRSHGHKKTLILGGENPKPAPETVDAAIVQSLKNYLAAAHKPFTTSWGAKATGADTSKPQFIHLGFHLPHTPVLPPKSFRDRFKTKSYKIPTFTEEARQKLPPQLQRIQKSGNMLTMSTAQKQQAIQDYYAFCAHGDHLLGEAITAFKEYCQQHNQPYLIVFTIGDHGWHLGEQGMAAKFSPWRESIHNAAIVVSSDPTQTPPGTVYSNMVEFVDFAPTLLQAAGLNIHSDTFHYLDGHSLLDQYTGQQAPRAYALGEINVIAGPRAYMHTERFRFSMRTRPFNNLVNTTQLGKDLDWALTAPPAHVDLALYDLQHDPLELNNLANDPAYQPLAAWFRQKLGRIVLGDGRIECDWAFENRYHHSTFAAGADDKKLNIPPHLIP